MKTFEQVRDLLTKAFSQERKRLKSYGTKASSFDLANVVAKHVLSVMSEARKRELIKLERYMAKHKISSKRLYNYIADRKIGLSHMSTALKNDAKLSDSKRPWKGYTHGNRS